jgi:glycosyltransferase involved in cell wall biosynthesis
MKILIVTNLYPPYYLGGYELHCAQVAEALHRSGHEVSVLSSVYGMPLSTFGNIQPRTEKINGLPVHRWLNQYVYEPQPARKPWTLFQAKRELWDARQFLKILTSFQPDIVNWWNMNGLTKTLVPIPRSWGIPDVHSIDDRWMIHEYGPKGEKASAFWANLWDGNWGPGVCRPLFRWVGRVWEKRIEREGIPTRELSHCPSHVCFLSEYMRKLHREAGLEFPSSEVIYGGVHPAQFYEPVRGQIGMSETLRVLYAGQISPDRGLHTVVEAIGHLAPAVRNRLKLSVAGNGQPRYLSEIKSRVEDLGLKDRVLFLGKVPHEHMPRIYKQHQILVFASARQEALGFVMIEAMLAGCAVVTTGSGGAMEIAALADLPLFPKDDPVALSQLLTRLATDSSEVARIASRGQEVALRDFSFDRMMERWTATLRRLQETKAVQELISVRARTAHEVVAHQ